MTPYTSTPRELGFRMPAEWERHEATWLSWPYNLNTWGKHLEAAERTTTAFIRALVPGERIDLCVANEDAERRARKSLEPLGLTEGQLRLHRITSGDVWIRDYGPIFVVRDREGKHEVAWTKWIYNALGRRDYADLLPGNDVPDAMPLSGMKKFDAGMVLEGGSIDVNGRGTLLTTESCLLDPNRNPEMTKEQIEDRLREFLDVANILWLGGGIAGDDTGGHIDDLARFLNATTVCAAVESDRTDENYAPLMDNFRRLQSMQLEDGRPLNVIPFPMPRPFSLEGRRMAASYVNFYIGNEVVVVPMFMQESDEKALAILRTYFPDRAVVGVDCREYVWGYGALHCSSQQQPV